MATTITETKAPKLNKANARDVAKVRAVLRATGDAGIYARSLSAIHRSSSRQQQAAVEAVIFEDRMDHLFGRHPVSGALISAVAA